MHLYSVIGAFFIIGEIMERKPKKYLSVSVESLEEGQGTDIRNAWLNCTISHNGFVGNVRFRASLQEKEIIARQLINLGNKLLGTNKGNYD